MGQEPRLNLGVALRLPTGCIVAPDGLHCGSRRNAIPCIPMNNQETDTEDKGKTLRSISVVSRDELTIRAEHVAQETPLEIRIRHERYPDRQNEQLAITMRSPGADEDLVRGFLYGEGIIDRIQDIARITRLDDNVMEATLGKNCAFDLADVKRRLVMTASCGVCGKSSLDHLDYQSSRLAWAQRSSVPAEVIQSLPGHMLEKQEQFASSGGVHAAALFTFEGVLVSIQEDIGRHNAMDKLVGASLQLEIADHVVLVSGRTSYEIVQKTAMLGVPVLAAIGPPSTMAIEVAEAEGITLLGFLKEDRFNIYTCPERIKV